MTTIKTIAPRNYPMPPRRTALSDEELFIYASIGGKTNRDQRAKVRKMARRERKGQRA